MKHSILILGHKDPHYLSSLTDYFDEDFLIYIHLDKKSKISKHEIIKLAQKKNVAFISKKYKTNWGGCNILKAELYLMKRALKDNPDGYIHLISGQDVPTKSLTHFKRFFNKNVGKEFLEYEPFPRKEWEGGSFARFQYYRPYDLFNCRTKKGEKICNKIIRFQIKHNLIRKIPQQFNVLYGGSAWFSLSADCVRYILYYTKKHPAFYRKLKYTFASDETYINTVLAHSGFKDNIVNNNLRYINWSYKYGSYPAILDENDYIEIQQSDALFARKIAFPASNTLIKKLNTIIMPRK